MRLTCLLCASFLFSCSSSGPQEPPLPAGNNPLGGGPNEDAFLPYPSNFYTAADAKAKTGLRVAIPAGVLPASAAGKPLDPAPLNRRDGFSPATRLMAYFPVVLDGSNLPPPAHVEASLAADSPVILVRHDTGERVPLFAELDQNADLAQGDRQALLIQPVVRLQPGTRYVVGLRGLRTHDGQPAAPLSGFQALRDGYAGDGGPRAGERARFGEIFADLARAGAQQGDLQLAWDFTTASDDAVTGRMVRMRDGALNYAPPNGQPAPPPITITENNPTPMGFPDLALQLVGTFTAPSYLTEDSAGSLNLGPDGEPVIRGYGQFPLVVHVPVCATQPSPHAVPVMVYGHGLFGDARSEMESGYQREIVNRLCMVQVGTNWLGLAQDDEIYVVQHVLGDFNQFSHVTDRLQQAHTNVAVLAHLIKAGGLEGLPGLMPGGQLLVDSQQVYYYGISDGGIQGGTAMALVPEFERGGLNVPGGFWSMMMYRSGDFGDYAKLIGNTYPDAVDQQMLVVLTQPLWDYTDPATYAPHLLHDPLPGVAVKKILYQEGLGDGQVPNVATRAMVRTMGLSLMNQPVEAVYGVPQVPPSQDSAYVQFDIGQMPRPGATNVPPPDNPVHEAIRRLEAAKEQLSRFLRQDGRVEDTCSGMPCVFPQQQR